MRHSRRAIWLTAALLAGGCAGSEPDDDAVPAHVDDDSADDDDSAEPEECDGVLAALEASATAGDFPLTVHFGSTGSCSPLGIAAYRWDFGVDGQSADGSAAEFTYLGTGSWTATLTVTDEAGDTSQATVEITVDAPDCPTGWPPATPGSLGPAHLDRSSGLAASRVHDGLLWSHNDDGQGSTLFALDGAGAEVAIFELGAVHTDWEDLAVGPDPVTGVSTLYIGDVGDDEADRDSVRLVMLPEPNAEQLEAGEPDTLTTSMLELTYPGGQRLDADALMFDPQTGDLYVLAGGADSPSTRVYRKAAPHLPGSTSELELVTSLALGGEALPGSDRVTAASISHRGDRILLRTEDSAYLWRRDASQPFAAAFDSGACPVPVPDEPGHEALAFAADGAGYYTVAAAPGALLWFVEFEPGDCDGLEARIRASQVPPLRVPLELTFELDPDCVPEGIQQVDWTIDGQPSSEISPSATFEHAGLIDVSATVTDSAGDTAAASRTFQLLPTACPVVGALETWGEVVGDDINEASGVAMSTRNGGVLWLHNDAGDSARLFAVGTDGARLGIWNLDVDARDWEDLTYGWDDTLAAQVLYVGDVGDNSVSREQITVHIVPEPGVPTGDEPTEVDLEADGFASMQLTYPDGASHNCETLMWDPVTGDLYLVTKEANDFSLVFRKPAPHEHGTSTEVELVASLRFGQAPLYGSSNTTGGDISPSGDRILIRTYSRAWLWHREPGQSIAEALAGEPCDVEAPDEQQGEAACFTPDGAGYVTVSEGTGQPIYYTPLMEP